MNVFANLVVFMFLVAVPSVGQELRSLERTLGHFRDAEQTLRTVTNAGSGDKADRATALNALGELLNEEGRLIESPGTFDQALKLSPGCTFATLAFVEQESGDLKGAERNYSCALRILHDHGLLNSNSAFDMMCSDANVLRKLHRRREAKDLDQELKAFRAAQ